MERTSVQQVLVEKGCVTAVETDRGSIKCEYFVSCAGQVDCSMGDALIRLRNGICDKKEKPLCKHFGITFVSVEIQCHAWSKICKQDRQQFFPSPS